MIDYFAYIVPSIVILLGIYRYAKMQHLVADRGELYYAFHQAWWKEIVETGLGALFVLFVILISWRKLDFASTYILKKYFQDPWLLIDSGYYSNLISTLKKSNQADYEALLSLKKMFDILPSIVVCVPTLITSFMPRMLRAGLYANGIFNGLSYYAYEEFGSHETEIVNGKATLTFKYLKKSMFGLDKEVTITINEDELLEVEKYLKHQIKDVSELEMKLNVFSKK